MMNDPFQGCNSQATIYRRVIEMENDYSPEEMANLVQQPDSLPEMALPLIQKNIEMMDRGCDRIRPFKRIQISENVNYYQGSAGHARSLLLCFCGNADRLMLPISVFLQHIPEDLYDVFVLRDPSRHCYLGGVPHYADRLEDVLIKIKQDISLDQYSDIRCIGTSIGGAAALYSGIFLGAKRAISVGGRHPSTFLSIDKFRAEGFVGTEFDDLLSLVGASPSEVELLAFFGDKVESDLQGALSLKQYLRNCRLARINHLDHHNILFKLFARGALKQFFQRYVFSDSIPPFSFLSELE